MVLDHREAVVIVPLEAAADGTAYSIRYHDLAGGDTRNGQAGTGGDQS
jgi:hypothetical protein